jgi:hypothetical protein
MSTRRDFDDEREQREWDAQESALRAERAGEVRAGSDPAVAQYRLVARALRAPALDAIPHDFAARVAARAEREARIASDHVEVWLERALVALLLLAGIGAVLFYRDELLARFTFSLPERAMLGIQTVLNWSLAIAACVGLSSMLARARKL